MRLKWQGDMSARPADPSYEDDTSEHPCHSRFLLMSSPVSQLPDGLLPLPAAAERNAPHGRAICRMRRRRRWHVRDSVQTLFPLLWSACRRTLAVGNTTARRARPRISHRSWRLCTTLAGRVKVSSLTLTYAFVSVACADKLKKFLQEYEVEGSRKFEPVLVCCSSCFALAFRLLAQMSGYALPPRWLVVFFVSVSMSDDLPS